MNPRINPHPNRLSMSGRCWLVTMFAAASALLLNGGVSNAQTAPLEDLSAFPLTTLTVSGGGGKHQFTLWVADTESREQQGLMFVRELPEEMGMVFKGPQPKVWTMWMRNTFVPLDMLFVATDGRVVKITHAIPHDDTTLSSDVPVDAVIELQGGISEKLHLKVGDVAKWKDVPFKPVP
jgi:uncharacterized protein